MKASDLALTANKLAPFPDIVCRVNDAIADGSSDAHDIGKIISLDTALTSSLLRAANSPLYRRVNSVSDIDDAVTLLGMQEIRNLVFAVSAADTVRAFPNPIIDLELFWKHSLYTAIIAEDIGNSSPLSQNISMFTAGLLHDVGQLLLFNQLPEQSQRAIEHSLDHKDGRDVYESERSVFGFDHMVVGSNLASVWNFPKELEMAIAHHHLPFEAPVLSDAAVIVHIAQSIAVLAELGSDELTDAPPLDSRALEHVGLQQEAVIELSRNAREALPELMGLFAL